MTVREAAAALEVSPRTVYDLIRSGQLQAESRGVSARGCLRITPEALEAFRLARRVGAPAPPASPAPSRRAPSGRSWMVEMEAEAAKATRRRA